MFNLFKPTLDGIMRVNQMYNICPNKNKINLVIGAYRTFDGKPFVFSSVETAKRQNINKFHEYLPITGDTEFINLSKKLYFNNHKTDFLGVQTLSGTGSLYLLAQLFREIINDSKTTIYLPNPTWNNHYNIFHTSGLNLSTYDHVYNKTWNFEYLYDNVKKIPDSNIILFHGCAHNPTGYDPMYHEWLKLVELCKNKNLLMIIDMAYLGFASGDIEKDAALLKIVDNYVFPTFVSTSYSKNFGLYSERVGNLFFRGNTQQETTEINDILQSVIRKMYSNPPSNGSNIVKTILENNTLYDSWLYELKLINDQYYRTRQYLKIKLENELNKPFNDITLQKGMFYYSNLTKEQVEKLREKNIFMPDNGRISLSGLNRHNIDTFIDEFVRVKHNKNIL
jgi:aspartate aminotransferase